MTALTLGVLLLLGAVGGPSPGRGMGPGPGMGMGMMGRGGPHPGMGPRPDETRLIPIHPRFWLLGVAHLCFGLLLGWILADRERAEFQEASARRATKEAQARVLQGQMNPHVLFNAISALTELVREDPVAAEAALVEPSGPAAGPCWSMVHACGHPWGTSAAWCSFISPWNAFGWAIAFAKVRELARVPGRPGDPTPHDPAPGGECPETWSGHGPGRWRPGGESQPRRRSALCARSQHWASTGGSGGSGVGSAGPSGRLFFLALQLPHCAFTVRASGPWRTQTGGDSMSPSLRVLVAEDKPSTCVA